MLIQTAPISNKCLLWADTDKRPAYAFALHDSISEIDAAEWDGLTAEHPFLSRRYLAAQESAPPRNMRFYYAVIYLKEKAVAAAYFQVIDFTSSNFGGLLDPEKGQFACTITDYIRKHIHRHLLNTDKLNVRLLICGNANVSGEHGIAISRKGNRAEVLHALSDVIAQVSIREKLRGKIAAVLIKDFYEPALKDTKIFESYGYHDFIAEPNMIVPIRWKSFGDYLLAMSKKYRNRAKTVVSRGAVLTKKELGLQEIADASADLIRLYRNVHDKAKFRMATLPADYFEKMKSSMGNDFALTAYYHEEKMVGFRSSFRAGAELEAHFIGLNYTLNKTADIYQNMLYDYVREAIEKGAERLNLGRTAAEIKSTVGAEAHPLTCYIKHRNPLSNRIIRPFIDYLRPGEWIPRNPFKETDI